MDKVLDIIYNQHDVVCNQKYGTYLPYSFHLRAVVAQVKRHIGCIKVPKFIDIDLQFEYQTRLYEKLVRAAAGHDLIEDARMTYNDVKQLLGEEVADIIYCCTEEKGKNRSERHSQAFFKTLKENRLAVFVKLCDIKANVLFSILTNSDMLKKYKSEYTNLRNELYIFDEYEPLWDELNKLIFCG